MMLLSLADADMPLTIRKIGGNPALKQHLDNFGFSVGETVTLINTLGDPMKLTVRGYELSLRKADAALTGSNQFAGNWPGVTVEKKEDKFKNHDGTKLEHKIWKQMTNSLRRISAIC